VREVRDVVATWAGGCGVVVDTVGVELFSLIIFLGGTGGVGLVDCKRAPTLSDVIQEGSFTPEGSRKSEWVGGVT
jgi:hypothetical protein